jgi:SAM-dependent methyltransferase
MTIEQRVVNESAAHEKGDVYAASERLHQRFEHVFTCPNTLRLEQSFVGAVRQYGPGNAILNFGCGPGEGTPLYSGSGARKVVGIDISESAIRSARQKYGDAAEFHVMDGHRTDFPDHSFDLVAGRAILHHLDFDRAVKEISRILRPGGHAIFVEPLRDNPAGKLLRALTPSARTVDELPLSGAQIAWADGQFGGASRHLFCNLISVPVGMITSLLPLSANNWPLRVADKIDQAIAATPFRTWMRYVGLCWQRRPV